MVQGVGGPCGIRTHDQPIKRARRCSCGGSSASGLSVKGGLWAGLRPPSFAREDASEAAISGRPDGHVGGSTRLGRSPSSWHSRQDCPRKGFAPWPIAPNGDSAGSGRYRHRWHGLHYFEDLRRVPLLEGGSRFRCHRVDRNHDSIGDGVEIDSPHRHVGRI